MKKNQKSQIKIPFKSLLGILSLAFILTSCNGNETPDPPKEQLLKVTASSDYVELNEELIDEIALTFSWTAARDQGADYAISYVTKFDLTENDFAKSIKTEIEEDIFSVSFTHGELQRLLTKNWYQAVNKEVPMSYRVIGMIDGPKYILPEVDDISVTIETYGPQVIKAAGVGMNGSAVPGGARLKKTIENQYVYAYYGPLTAGEINFPLDADGARVLSPATENPTLPITDAEAMDVRVKTAEEANFWVIPSAGNYRIVVDLEGKTAAIYSEANDIEVVKVKHLSTSETEEPVTEMYAYGESTGWAWTDEYALSQSLANPNVWIFNAKAITGRTKFGVMKDNGAFVFSCQPKDADNGQDADVELNIPTKITGSNGRGQRNSYFKVPSGTNFIVLDIKEMTAAFSVQ